MARIKIQDLPKDMKISKNIMKQIRGGINRRTTDSLSRITEPILLDREKAGGGKTFIGIIDIPG